jgi:hypothetical protein
LWYIYLVCRVLDPMRSQATCVPSDLESSKVVGGLYLVPWDSRSDKAVGRYAPLNSRFSEVVDGL